MANYSEHYNLRLEAIGTKEVLNELKMIDQYAERLEKDGIDLRVDVNGLASAEGQIRRLSAQAEQLERDGLDLNIDVNGYAKAMTEINGITSAQARAIKANQNEARTQVQVERQKIGVLNDQFRLYNNLQGATTSWTDKIQAGLRTTTQFGNVLTDISSKVQRIGAGMAIVGGVGVGGIALTLGSQIKGALQYAQEVEKAKLQLKAQGVEGEKLNKVYQEIVRYANISPFDVSNMTQAVSQMNAFIGNIDKSTEATEAFGESIFASGGQVEDLGEIGYNLGQIYTNAFTKVDFRQVLQRVPAMSQALREYKGEVELTDIATGKLVKKSTGKLDLSNWQEFNELLGDDPTTQAIERKYSAFDLLTDAIQRHNDKTNALETANEAVSAKMENMIGQYQTLRHEALENSGAYKAFGSVIDALGDKMKDPSVKNALEDLFKSISPLFDNLKKSIEDFDMNAFVGGIKDGATNIVNYFKGIVNNPIIKGFGKLLGTAIGAEGNVGDVGRGLSKLLTTGITTFMLGTAGKVIGTALSKGSAGVNIGITVAKGFGNMFTKTKLPASFATEAGNVLGGKVGSQLQTPSFSSAFSGALGKFLKGSMQLGGGIAIAGIGVGVGAWASAQGMKAIVDTAKKLTDAVNYISDNLPKADSDKAYQMVAKLHLLEKMSAIVSNAGLGGGMKATISSAITNVAAIATGFGMATGNLTMAGVGLMVQGVRLLGAYIDQISAQTEGIKIENVGKLADLPKKFSAIPADFDPNSIKDKIDKIVQLVSKVEDALNIQTIGNGQAVTSNLGEMLSRIDQAIPADTTARVTKTFTNLKTLASTLQSFGNIQDVGAQVVTGLNNLRSTISQIVNSGVFTDTMGTGTINLPSAGGGLIGPNQVQTDTTMGNQLGQLEAQLKTVTSKISKMLPQIQLLSDLSAKLTAIPPIDPGAITKKMQDINTTVTGISEIWGGAETVVGDGRSGGGSIGSVDFSAVLEIIRGGIKVGKEVSKLGTMNVPNATPQINNMKSTIEALSGLNGGGGGLGGLVSKLQETSGKITEFASKAGGTGISSTNNFRNSLNQMGNSATSNGSKISSLGSKISEYGSKADSGKSKTNSLKSAVDNLGNAGSSAGGKISSLAGKIGELASRASSARGDINSLKNALNDIPSKKTITISLNDQASSGISNIQSALNGVKSKTVDVTTNYKETGKKDGKATGGMAFARGGYVSTMFKNAMRTMNMGQDTVNAVLARGEAVIRRSSTALVGKGFIDNLNNGRLQQAYEELGNRMGSMYNNRYDNRSFNNQANITQNFYGSPSQGNNFIKQYIKGVQ